MWVLFTLFFGFTSVEAGKLSDLSTVQCRTAAGQFVHMDVGANALRAGFADYPELSSEFNEEPHVLERYVWVPDRLFGFGGWATDVKRRISMVVNFLITPEQENNLKAKEILRIHAVDVHGLMIQDEMECNLGFN